MAREDREERELGLQVDRESLVPAAREPEEDSRGAGFGSHYPGPVEQHRDAPLLGTRVPGEEDVEPAVPQRSALPEASGPWLSEVDRDIRRERAAPAPVRPTSE